MKKIELGQTIGVLANVGVIAGIVFLGFEVRQNTEVARSLSIQSILDQSLFSSMVMVENRDLRESYIAARTGNLTEDQKVQLDWFYGGLLRIMLNRFYQAQFGTLDEAFFVELGGRSVPFTEPYFEPYWARRKASFSVDFQEYIEREILPLSLDDLGAADREQ